AARASSLISPQATTLKRPKPEGPPAMSPARRPRHPRARRPANPNRTPPASFILPIQGTSDDLRAATAWTPGCQRGYVRGGYGGRPGTGRDRMGGGPVDDHRRGFTRAGPAAVVVLPREIDAG